MFSRNGLHDLLDYEIACAKRYRRFVSLALVKLPETDSLDVSHLMSIVRDSDRFFPLDQVPNGIAFVMAETDGPAAIKAVERIMRTVDAKSDFRSGVASFPQDGRSTSELVEAGYIFLTKALNHNKGSILINKNNTFHFGEST